MQFHTTDELQITTHVVMKATMLHDKPLELGLPHLLPPTSGCIWQQLGEPSGTQPLPSDREEEPHLSPSNPNPDGKILQHLQANLGDLADNELCQLMEDLCQEVAL